MGGGESAALNKEKSELKYLAIFSGLPFNLRFTIWSGTRVPLDALALETLRKQQLFLLPPRAVPSSVSPQPPSWFPTILLS